MPSGEEGVRISGLEGVRVRGWLSMLNTTLMKLFGLAISISVCSVRSSLTYDSLCQ